MVSSRGAEPSSGANQTWMGMLRIRERTMSLRANVSAQVDV